MIRTAIFWVLCFLFCVFALGSFPLPPVPGRPFPEGGEGASRFVFFDGVSRQLHAWGAETPFLIALGLLMLIFALWMVLRTRDRHGNHRGLSLLGFACFFATSLVAADFSREIGVAGLKEYADFRLHWILRGERLAYPKWPTERLKRALESQAPTEILAALDAVVGPEFGKIPKFDGLFAGCRDGYLRIIRESGPLPTTTIVAGDGRVTRVAYPLACRLMDQIIVRLGKADARNARECLYGPAVKILHALDRQKLRCGLASIQGEKRPDVVCAGFRDAFGTTAFSFCPN